MALVFPYPLAFLSDLLQPGDTVWTLNSNQEFSGSGDGRFWGARLSSPLWSVAVNLGQLPPPLARAVDARVRALGEGNQTFLFEDRSYWPAGGVYPGTAVALHAVDADRTAIRLTGLPAGYKVYSGDRFSAVFGGRYYFGEFVESNTTGVANLDAGRPPVPEVAPTPALTTGYLTVNPPLPFSAVAGTSLELYRPILRAQIPPRGYKGYTAARSTMYVGASLSFLQKM